jgi:hypothetical protein
MTNTVMQSDPNLLRLPAAALHGTFLQAYSLLTKLASKVGWDELLRARSDVFVMEEEYRKAKEAEETRRKSTTIETIKQVQENRRLSALEEAKQTLDSNPLSENNGGMYHQGQHEGNDGLSHNEPETTDVPKTVSQENPTEDANVATTAETAISAGEHEEEPASLEPNDTININETEAVPDQQVSEVANEVTNTIENNHVEDSESKENGLKDADTDDNDSNIPSGARTPTSGNAGDEKELPSPVGKNAKKNQKKRQKKKNKNKKLDLSPNVANDGEEPDEVPSPVTPVVGGLDSPALVQPTEEDTSPGDKLDINSEEFAEIDITSSESVTVDVSESVEKEDTTLETPEAVVQEEPSAAESNVTAADEPDQKVPETVPSLEPTMDHNADGSIGPSALPDEKLPNGNIGNGLGIQHSDTVREPAEASKQVSCIWNYGLIVAGA